MVPGTVPRIARVRIVLQRVGWARVHVDGEEVGAIGPGLLALVGAARGDTAAEAERLAAKTVRLRLFDGPQRPFDVPLTEVPGAAVAAHGVAVARGRFGEHMDVSLENDGPVTLVLEGAAMATPRR